MEEVITDLEQEVKDLRKNVLRKELLLEELKKIKDSLE